MYNFWMKPTSPKWTQPVTLSGRNVRLEPLSREHHAALTAVGLDPVLWRWIPVQVRSAEDMSVYIEAALADHDRGVSLPFATCLTNGEVIGSTRYMNIDMSNRRLEIGSTWITPKWQRSAVNTEAKYLMLRHAFETLGCNRVELKTDALNEKSRAAILRIGAKQEGIFRKHVVCHDGRIRDSVYFSIIAEEWPDVKAKLEVKIAKPRR
jgi:RimJ/RimL family protein N-acetyltransferase